MKRIAAIFFLFFCLSPAHASVNVTSGNLTHRQELFSAGSGPLALAVGLSYNSTDRLDGPLGPGWSHSYDIYLHENADGTMVLTGGVEKHFYYRQLIHYEYGCRWVGSDETGYWYICYYGFGTEYTEQSAPRFYTASIGDPSILLFDNKQDLDPSNDDWEVKLSSGLIYRFDHERQLTAIVDRHGNTVTFDRAVANQVTVHDPAGRASVFTYEDDKVSSIADSAGKLYELTYDSAGRLSKVTAPAPVAGAPRPAWEYLYNAQGLLEYLKDPEGHITKYGYDAQGRVTRKVDPEGVIDTAGAENAEGHVKTLQYDTPTAGQTTVTEKDGGVWMHARSESGFGKTNPAGDTESSIYYPPGDPFFGQVKETREPVDADTVYVTTYLLYDGSGNPVEVTGHARHTTAGGTVNDPPDRHFLFNYGSYARPTLIADLIAGTQTAIAYITDPATGIETVTITAPKINTADASGPQTVLVYDAQGKLTTVTDPLGRTTTYAYHPGTGDLWSVTDATGLKTEFLDYDLLGNPHTAKVIGSDNKVQTTLLGYDALSRLKSVRQENVLLSAGGNPTTLLTEFGYDKVGNRTTVDDAEGNRTAYGYNYKGQVTSIIDANAQLTELLYSGAGCGSCGGGVDKLIGVIDANHVGAPEPRKMTGFAYYQTGELKSETDPLGKRLLYAYYPSGLLEKKLRDVNGDGEIDGGDQLLLSFVYAPDGKLQSKTDHVAGETTTFTYNANGRLQTAASPALTYTFDYYANGWLKSVADGARTVEYEYDAAGRRELVRLKEGATVLHTLDYVYDAQKRLQDIVSSAGTFTLGYDGFGRRAGLSYPNGVQAVYAYNDLTDWLTGITYSAGETNLLSLAYPAHDKVGNRKERSEEGVGTDYAYDDVYQLTQAKTGAAEENFTYDPVGNRKSGPTVKDTEAAAYTHDDANRMLEGRKFDYAYDDFGNQQYRYLDAAHTTFWQFTWNGDNRLTKAELKKDAAVLRTVTFKYDPLGRRIEKKVEGLAPQVPVPVTTTYIYDGEDIALEYVNDGTTTTSTHYVHGPGIDEPLAMVRGGQSYYYHADGLGSVVAITDAGKNIVQRYTYESFGMLTPQDPEFENAYTYTGREWDKEIGLYYYRARYYDPMEGRFISRDPIGFAGGDVNLYGYVENNSVNWTDPFGLEKANCTEDFTALMKLIDYEKTHGKYSTVRGEYNPFSTTLTDLNKDYESTFGPVDIDWMLRSSGFGLAGNGTLGAFGAWMDYRVGKFYWNVGRSLVFDTKLEFDTVFDESNYNAPHAASEWLNSNDSLSDLFSPYLERCKCP